jgi:hypothetical protein
MPVCTHTETIMDAYVKWMRQRNLPLFQAGGTWWKHYRRCPVPASPKPEPIELTEPQARSVLRKSGAFFLRYFSRTVEEPTGFWYTACDRYDFDDLSHKTRNQIRRAYKGCVVRRTDQDWLATHGYDCYATAFARYRNARPDSRETFEKELLDSVGGPFDSWAVFVGSKLAGYSKCAFGEGYATIFVLKLHPDYLSFYPAYSLIDTILKTYVTDERKVVDNGFRSITHDTNTWIRREFRPFPTKVAENPAFVSKMFASVA